MAASPVTIAPALVSNLRRRPLALTHRRLAANRRNAARATGPRTAEGKAKVARNAIKHGFFAGQEKWTPRQLRDFEETLGGLRDEFKPQGALEESCVATMAESYVRMAAMLRYENLAALKYHQHRERELNYRIAVADTAEAAFLKAERDQLCRAGLWGPTIPGPREAIAIARYSGSLDRAIRRAISELETLKNVRIYGASSPLKVKKQTHCSSTSSSVLSAARRTSTGTIDVAETQKQTHFEVAPAIHESEKTNPLSSMFTGNRHQRRRAKALAARRQVDTRGPNP